VGVDALGQSPPPSVTYGRIRDFVRPCPHLIHNLLRRFDA
jgi:hypothetical protein